MAKGTAIEVGSEKNAASNGGIQSTL